MRGRKLTQLQEKILQLIYGYELDIECKGVVFNCLADVEEKVVRLKSTEAEPLYVSEEGEVELVYYGYYAAVVEDCLNATAEQLIDALAVLQEKKMINKFSLSESEEKGTYLMGHQGNIFQGRFKGEPCAYQLMQNALDYLEVGKFLF